MTSPRTYRHRGAATGWLVLIGALAATCAALFLTAQSAAAHPLSTTAVLLDVGTDEVTGQVEMPIDRLALAVDRPTLTTQVAEQPATIVEFREYLASHVSATTLNTGPGAGRAWTVLVTGGSVQSIDGVDHLVYDLTLRPPGGVVRDFAMHDDAIVHHLLSHRVFVSSRPAGSATYTAVGLIDWQTQTLTVPASPASAERGFRAAVRLGIHHIAEGADHLLFLLMLLLPAPLLVRAGRWVPSDSQRRSCWRVVHVVTAFAVGHSLTLALGALGLVHVPTRVVESGIALSILVSGLHAIRPLVRGGEVWIAAGFGLLHGLSFAALLGQLDLTRWSLLTELLGFNLGIELTQLIVVALVMPSLMVLNRTAVYAAARVAVAGSGVVLAAAWFAERITVIRSNPLEPVPEALVSHPFLTALVLALAAAGTWAVPGWRLLSPARRLTSTGQPKVELVDLTQTDSSPVP